MEAIKQYCEQHLDPVHNAWIFSSEGHKYRVSLNNAVVIQNLAGHCHLAFNIDKVADFKKLLSYLP